MDDNLIAHLQNCIDRLQAGEESARNELINHACEGLQRFTRTMLQDHTRVRRWEWSGDVCHNATLRLWFALRATTPTSVRGYLRLASLQIRIALIDLARHYYEPEGAAVLHPTQENGNLAASTPEPAYDHPDSAQDANGLATWTEFHNQVESLHDEEREVFDLLWYQGLRQAEAAELLDVDEWTVKRRWQTARLKLSRALQGQSSAL